MFSATAAFAFAAIAATAAGARWCSHCWQHTVELLLHALHLIPQPALRRHECKHKVRARRGVIVNGKALLQLGRKQQTQAGDGAACDQDCKVLRQPVALRVFKIEQVDDLVRDAFSDGAHYQSGRQAQRDVLEAVADLS